MLKKECLFAEKDQVDRVDNEGSENDDLAAECTFRWTKKYTDDKKKRENKNMVQS